MVRWNYYLLRFCCLSSPFISICICRFSNHVEIPGHATLPDHVSQPEVKCIGQAGHHDDDHKFPWWSPGTTKIFGSCGTLGGIPAGCNGDYTGQQLVTWNNKEMEQQIVQFFKNYTIIQILNQHRKFYTQVFHGQHKKICQYVNMFQASLVTVVLTIVMHLLLEKMLRSMIGVVMMFQSQLGQLDLWLKFSGLSVQIMPVGS